MKFKSSDNYCTIMFREKQGNELCNIPGKSFNLKTESRKQLDGDGSLKVFVLLNKLSELLRILANNFNNDIESHMHTHAFIVLYPNDYLIHVQFLHFFTNDLLFQKIFMI